MIKFTVFDSGYIGRVTGVCLTAVGNDVIGSEVDPKTIVN
ncbi:MAG: hypothetical protein EXR83_02005 [Gammaproteobacteria bacterium]|nr:hypothetical protein [Gammaproteobacteria bacterium]